MSKFKLLTAAIFLACYKLASVMASRLGRIAIGGLAVTAGTGLATYLLLTDGHDRRVSLIRCNALIDLLIDF
jgi:hypothetical protein